MFKWFRVVEVVSKKKKKVWNRLESGMQEMFSTNGKPCMKVANYNYIEDKQTFKVSLARHSVLYAPSPFRSSPLATWHLATCLYLSLNLVTIGVMLYVMLTLHKLP